MNTGDPILDAWPNCAMPDCGHRCCTWTRTVYCGVHAKELLGEAEMIRRYNLTHEHPDGETGERGYNLMLPEDQWPDFAAARPEAGEDQ